jgi:2-polyprenyl-3-methyl-5-hydroxy-6-metoxy-1,4-benzoquinol methylase
VNTADTEYAQRMVEREGRWWKRLLCVQYPYRWNLRRLHPGFVLDVGCGIGRNLTHLDGRGIGVDHNPTCVDVANARGLRAFTPDGFVESEFARAGRFDSLILAHVVEHMGAQEAEELLRQYLPWIKRGGMVILITPQEAGFRSDPTHVEFVDLRALDRLGRALGIERLHGYSFPFPRTIGQVFKYNEFVWVGRIHGPTPSPGHG